MSGDGRAGIDAALVRRLVAAQLPQWRHLPVVPVEADGHDNRTYRLGADLSVRLPTAAAYAPAVAKEHVWLPRLAPHLPLAVPEPVALGAPGEDYPHPWSVRRWLPGRTASPEAVSDPITCAEDLGGFLRRLRSAGTAGAPLAGEHSFGRGGPPAAYDEQTRAWVAALGRVGGPVEPAGALAVWDAALAPTWERPGVWFHGDVAVGNLLVDDEGRLSAVIDFGTCGVGDPACDLVVAWTFFDEPSRRVFRHAVGLDEDTWARARGWALWKALQGLAIDPASPVDRRTVDRVVAEHVDR